MQSFKGFRNRELKLTILSGRYSGQTGSQSSNLDYTPGNFYFEMASVERPNQAQHLPVEPFRLMDLLRAIRDLIYSFCLLLREKSLQWYNAKTKTYNHEVCIDSVYLMSLSLSICLLLVNRQFHDELIDAFSKPPTLKAWMLPRGTFMQNPSNCTLNRRILKPTQICFIYVHMRAFYHEWKPGGWLEDQKSPGTEIDHFYSCPAQILFLKALVPQ